MKVNVLAHYLVGCLGMHLVARRVIGVTHPAATAFVVALFVGSGGIALHLAAGHTTFLSVFYLPLLVYGCWRAAEGHVRGTARLQAGLGRVT